MAGASLKMAGSATATVASTVYQNLPTKEQVRASMDAVSSMITTSPPSSADSAKTPPNSGNIQNSKSSKAADPQLPITSNSRSFGWIQHLQRLMTDTKAEKASIDRLVSLGFGRKESIE